MKLQYLIMVLLFFNEGNCTHLETCTCHDIKDIVHLEGTTYTDQLTAEIIDVVSNNSLQDAAMNEMMIERIVKDTMHKAMAEMMESKLQELRENIRSLLRPIQASLDYHLPTPARANSKDNPAMSCQYLKQFNADSGYYWVKHGLSAVRVYCNMNLTCGDITGGWMRVADLDMRDSNQICPSGFTTRTSPKRLCDHPSSSSCIGTKYSVHNIEYSHVCGRIIGYQYNVPIAFYYNYYYNYYCSLDQRYAFGVSLTHGPVNRRSHIWSFIGAADETSSNYRFKCPCINKYIYSHFAIPSFVGNDYFCDTALTVRYTSAPNRYTVHVNDPLWDGKGCGSNNACCNFPTNKVKPPWFYKQLSTSTTDDIEMRLCKPSSDGSTPIEIVELYVQ